MPHCGHVRLFVVNFVATERSCGLGATGATRALDETVA